MSMYREQEAVLKCEQIQNAPFLCAPHELALV
jgi:hypothetical protein